MGGGSPSFIHKHNIIYIQTINPVIAIGDASSTHLIQEGRSVGITFPLYYVSKKSWPISYSKLLYKWVKTSWTYSITGLIPLNRCASHVLTKAL